jgi:hypothetical protein
MPPFADWPLKQPRLSLGSLILDHARLTQRSVKTETEHDYEFKRHDHDYEFKRHDHDYEFKTMTMTMTPTLN